MLAGAPLQRRGLRLRKGMNARLEVARPQHMSAIIDIIVPVFGTVAVGWAAGPQAADAPRACAA